MIQYYLSFKKKKTNFLFLPATIQGELKFLTEGPFKMASTLVETENKKMRTHFFIAFPHLFVFCFYQSRSHLELAFFQEL